MSEDDWAGFHQFLLEATPGYIEDGLPLLVYAGGWHIWFELNTYGGGVEFEFVSTAAVPPKVPSVAQRQRMREAGWILAEEDGFIIRDPVVTDDVAVWIADLAVATLRDGIGVSLEQAQIGPGMSWSSLPGADDWSPRGSVP